MKSKGINLVGQNLVRLAHMPHDNLISVLLAYLWMDVQPSATLGKSLRLELRGVNAKHCGVAKPSAVPSYQRESVSTLVFPSVIHAATKFYGSI